MTPTPIRTHDMHYQHDLALRNLPAEDAMGEAVAKAARLSLEVENEMSQFAIVCAATFLAPKRWLLDTGVRHDLTSVNSVGSKIIARRTKAKVDYQLCGVGGVAPIEWQAPIEITAGGSSEKINSFLMDSQYPTVLTVGQRCIERGNGFYWRPFAEKPEYVHPQGRHLPVAVEHYLPYLVCDSVDCAPGVPSQASGGGDGTAAGGPGGLNADGSSGSSAPPVIAVPGNPGAVSERGDVPNPPVSSDDEGEEKLRRDLKAEAKSKRHLMCHFPKNPLLFDLPELQDGAGAF